MKKLVLLFCIGTTGVIAGVTQLNLSTLKNNYLSARGRNLFTKKKQQLERTLAPHDLIVAKDSEREALRHVLNNPPVMILEHPLVMLWEQAPGYREEILDAVVVAQAESADESRMAALVEGLTKKFGIILQPKVFTPQQKHTITTQKRAGYHYGGVLVRALSLYVEAIEAVWSHSDKRARAQLLPFVMMSSQYLVKGEPVPEELLNSMRGVVAEWAPSEPVPEKVPAIDRTAQVQKLLLAEKRWHTVRRALLQRKHAEAELNMKNRVDNRSAWMRSQRRATHLKHRIEKHDWRLKQLEAALASLHAPRPDFAAILESSNVPDACKKMLWLMGRGEAYHKYGYRWARKEEHRVKAAQTLYNNWPALIFLAYYHNGFSSGAASITKVPLHVVAHEAGATMRLARAMEQLAAKRNKAVGGEGRTVPIQFSKMPRAARGAIADIIKQHTSLHESHSLKDRAIRLARGHSLAELNTLWNGLAPKDQAYLQPIVTAIMEASQLFDVVKMIESLSDLLAVGAGAAGLAVLGSIGIAIGGTVALLSGFGAGLVLLVGAMFGAQVIEGSKHKATYTMKRNRWLAPYQKAFHDSKVRGLDKQRRERLKEFARTARDYARVRKIARGQRVTGGVRSTAKAVTAGAA